MRIGAPIYQATSQFGLKMRAGQDSDQRYVECDEINGKSLEGLCENQKMMLGQFELFLRKNNIANITPEEYFTKLLNA